MFYFVSEGADQLKRRLSSYNSHIPKPPPFKVYKRTQNFADVVVPDGLNIIDYIRVPKEGAWAIHHKLLEIMEKLKDGVAVVALQKPKGRDEAFGKEFTLFDASLAISIANGYFTYTKVKVPKPNGEGKYPDIYHMKQYFDIDKGINLVKGDEIIE